MVAMGWSDGGRRGQTIRSRRQKVLSPGQQGVWVYFKNSIFSIGVPVIRDDHKTHHIFIFLGFFKGFLPRIVMNSEGKKALVIMVRNMLLSEIFTTEMIVLR